MLKSWKTTISGTLLLCFAAYLFSKGKDTEAVIAAGAGIGLLSAKDSNVTGGTTPQ